MWIKALPCIAFSVKERKIARKHGFLSYPDFLDNFYIASKGKSDIKRFMRNLCKYKKFVIFAVYPDEMQDLGQFHNNYDFCDWIYPLHSKQELDFVLKNDFEWVGMPHSLERRDYSREWFVRECDRYGLKKWYLGFWAEDSPEILHQFHGFDSTLPETYSGKFGKLWITWRCTQDNHGLKTIELFEQNVSNFENAITTLSLRQTLIPYIEGGTVN